MLELSLCIQYMTVEQTILIERVTFEIMIYVIMLLEQLIEVDKVEKEVEKETVTKDILNYEEELRRKKEEEWKVRF